MTFASCPRPAPAFDPHARRPFASAAVGAALAGLTLLVGCDALPTLTLPRSGQSMGNVQLCRDYVDHMNGLEPCLGLSYDAENFCEGVGEQEVDLAPFYACLVENTSCKGGEPTMTVDGCSPPVASADPPAGQPTPVR